MTAWDIFPEWNYNPTLLSYNCCPLQLNLYSDVSITDSGILNRWIFCNSSNAMTCHILKLEAQSNDHLLGIMPIQCATSGDELTFNQPTNYAVWSENTVACSSIQTYKSPTGLVQTYYAWGGEAKYHLICTQRGTKFLHHKKAQHLCPVTETDCAYSEYFECGLIRWRSLQTGLQSLENSHATTTVTIFFFLKYISPTYFYCRLFRFYILCFVGFLPILWLILEESVFFPKILSHEQVMQLPYPARYIYEYIYF